MVSNHRTLSIVLFSTVCVLLWIQFKGFAVVELTSASCLFAKKEDQVPALRANNENSAESELEATFLSLAKAYLQDCTNESFDRIPARPRRPSQGLNIVTQFYNASRPPVKYMLNRALLKNLKNDAVEAVHILAESMEDYDEALSLASTVQAKNKVKLGSMLGRRMNYSDAFEYADSDLKGKYVAITNADIFFGDSFDDALFFDLFLDEPKKAVALSRWEDKECVTSKGVKPNEKRYTLCERYIGSHDAFVYQSPAKLRLDYLNFQQNHYGAENVVNYEFSNASGFRLFNPCHRYRIYHVDCNRNAKPKNPMPRIDRRPYPPATVSRSGWVWPTCYNGRKVRKISDLPVQR